MERDRKRRYKNCILALAVMGASALLMSLFFDFYFDMNDDTMMRDIMSGVYSGYPSGHNMQTLYPLGVLIALCYRIYGSFPWYGAFLFLCQFGCFFLVGARLCTLADIFCEQQHRDDIVGGAAGIGAGGGAEYGGTMGRRFTGKLLCLLLLVCFQWGIWMTHMVNTQYTITSGMLVGAAVFLFLTIPEGPLLGKDTTPLSVKAFLMRSLPALLLVLLAFHLRSEMALLTLPFLGLSGLFCWWEERPVFEKKTLKKYGGLFLLLLAGMGLSLAADSLAYGGEWRTFRQFFNDRTTIYDFYPEVLTEEAFDADLEKLGVSFGAQILLTNYNFGLDEGIDAQMLSDVASYAKEHVGGAKDWAAVFMEKLRYYCYRNLHGGDAPYNLLVILGYGANIILAVILMRRDVRKLIPAAIRLCLVFFMRSALWMFVLMRGRDPERITHPLYLVEFCLLAGMFLSYLWREMAYAAAAAPETADLRRGNFAAGRNILRSAAAALFLLSAWGLWRGFPAVQADQARRQEINREWEAIDAYCRAHPDTFYFEDVYSTVAFSGKLLECRDNTLANYDIAGGWMCKSPLYQKKLAVFGIEEAADALAEGKAGFIMSHEEESLRGLSWMEVPYMEKGMAVYIEEYEEISENYGAYRVIPVSETGQFQGER